MTEPSQITRSVVAALTEALNTHCAVLGLNGEIIKNEERTSRHSDRVFFDMPVSQNLGIFAAVISTVQLSVYYEPFEGGYWINTSLSYTHPGGGSNGSTVATVYLKGDFTLEAIRWPDGSRTPELTAA